MDIYKNISDLFQDVSKFSYVNAKNKIKSILHDENNTFFTVWLSQFIDYEKNYFHLIFITYKQMRWMSRKKQCESFVELKNQIILWKKNSKKEEVYIPEELVESLLYVIEHRCQMIELYQSIVIRKSRQIFNLSDRLPKLVEIKNNWLEKYKSAINLHHYLASISSLFMVEMDILYYLMVCHEKLTNLYFLEPLNTLQKVFDNLDKVGVIDPPFPLLTWLRDVAKFLLDKFTLYFQPILVRYAVMLQPLTDTPTNTNMSITSSMNTSLHHYLTLKPDQFPLVDKFRQLTNKLNVSVGYQSSPSNTSQPGPTPSSSSSTSTPTLSTISSISSSMTNLTSTLNNNTVNNNTLPVPNSASISPTQFYLLFDTTKQSHLFKGQGYVLPISNQEQPLIGIQNYQTIFSTSGVHLNQNDLFIAVSLIREKLSRPEIDTVNTGGGPNPTYKIAYFQRKQPRTPNNSANMINSPNQPSVNTTTFYVVRLDTRVYLALTMEVAKTERDRLVILSINELVRTIQGCRLAEALPNYSSSLMPQLIS